MTKAVLLSVSKATFSRQHTMFSRRIHTLSTMPIRFTEDCTKRLVSWQQELAMIDYFEELLSCWRSELRSVSVTRSELIYELIHQQGNVIVRRDLTPLGS